MKSKEVKFRVRTESHDREHKMKKVLGFLEAGDQVKLVVSMRGRENAHPGLAELTLQGILAECPDRTFVGPIRVEGKSISAMVKFRR